MQTLCQDKVRKEEEQEQNSVREVVEISLYPPPSTQKTGREEREQLQIEFPHMSRSPSSSQSPSLLQKTPSRVRGHQRPSQPSSLGLSLNEITPSRTSTGEQRSISFTNMETGEKCIECRELYKNMH